MSDARKVVAGGAVLVGAAAVGWLAARVGVEDRIRACEGAAEAAREEAAELRAAVARLREETGTPRDASARVAGAPSAPSLRAVVDDHAERLSAVEAALAQLPAGTAAAAAPPARGRQVLAEVLANRDGTRVAAIRGWVQELVRVGDAAVPEIVATLDSGLDTRYVESRPLLQHLKGYDGVRMVLHEALREIGTPAARDALVASVARSGRVSDYRDLICPISSSTHAALVDRVAALLPEMLRCLAANPMRGTGTGDAVDLSWAVSSWIRRRGAPGTVEPLVDVLRSLPEDDAGAWLMAYSGLFRLLLETAPDRAAGVALEYQQRSGKRMSLWTLSEAADTAPRAKLPAFCGALLSAHALTPEDRLQVVGPMPDRAFGQIKDPAARAQDARPYAAFLEERIAAETDERVRGRIAEKLAALRRDLDAIAK